MAVGDRTAVYPNNEEKLKQLIDYVTKIGLAASIQPIDLEDVFIKLAGEKL